MVRQLRLPLRIASLRFRWGHSFVARTCLGAVGADDAGPYLSEEYFRRSDKYATRRKYPRKRDFPLYLFRLTVLL